jgi:hypothetical protein
MITRKWNAIRVPGLLVALMTGAGMLVAQSPANQDEIIAQLRSALAQQQKQIDSLRQTLEQQQQLIEKAVHPASLGQVASVTPIIPAAPMPAMAKPAIPVPQATPAAASKNPCEAPPDGNAVPAYLRIGSACIVPVGFMDMTAVWRDKNAGSSIGTNFASIPYANTAAGHLTEFRFSPQNSRLGFRADGEWKGAHFTGYNEFDFLGTSGGNNLGVTNGAFVPRLRLFWIDMRKDKWEFLAGQSWSMLTPNRKAISAIPGDLFYSQVIDVNYMAGLTWTRQPGLRVLYHPSSTVTAGLSLENPDQYIGGSAGGPTVTLPAGALSGLGGSEVDNASNVLNTPNLHPDIIAKIAYDPGSRFHAELAGIERTFRIWNSATNTYSTKVGAGLQFGANVEVVKNVRLITTNYWSAGGGRYLFGQAPDFIIRANGDISPIKSGGSVDGLEWTVKNTLLYTYYGGIYVGRNTALDADGKTKIGYGYAGSPAAQNRAINEITWGFNQTMWKNPRYGAFNLMGQYQWTQRNPWAVLTGAPKSAHDNAVYINLRYTLPGSMPSF